MHGETIKITLLSLTKKTWQHASELQATQHCYLLQCIADGSNVE